MSYKRAMKNLLEVMQMFVTLTVVMALWVYTYVKTHQIVYTVFALQIHAV